MNNGFLVFVVFIALVIVGAQLYKQHLEDEERSKETRDD